MSRKDAPSFDVVVHQKIGTVYLNEVEGGSSPEAVSIEMIRRDDSEGTYEFTVPSGDMFIADRKYTVTVERVES